jgi:hypothetical protein
MGFRVWPDATDVQRHGSIKKWRSALVGNVEKFCLTLF